MSQAIIRPRDVVRSVSHHPYRLIVPVVAFGLLSVVYAAFRPVSWEAAQALVVRDEAGDRLSRPGRFTHQDEMKTSQETILELAKSRSVLAKALAEVGPPADRDSDEPWPSADDLEALQGSVKVTPPKGAEFGKTEVFYLKVQSRSQERAIQLAQAVCRQLQNRFAELRESKARSTTDELTKSASLARADLEEATRALNEIEQQVGSDLAELRILNDLPSGDSDLRRTATELERELRSFQAAQLESQEFLKLLTIAQDDPDKLLASPSILIKAQPALGRLKDGLVDAQLRTGQLMGTMAEEHPLVQGARAAEEAIRNQVHNEIQVAIRGIEVELRVDADHIRALETQSAGIQARLARLTSVRAQYSNLAASAKNRSETLKAVEHELSEARPARRAAHTTSLINVVDTPDTGTRPAGPGGTMIVLGGMGGGLLIGFSILFLTLSPSAELPSESRSKTLYAPSPVAKQSPRMNLKQALQRVAETV